MTVLHSVIVHLKIGGDKPIFNVYHKRYQELYHKLARQAYSHTLT